MSHWDCWPKQRSCGRVYVDEPGKGERVGGHAGVLGDVYYLQCGDRLPRYIRFNKMCRFLLLNGSSLVYYILIIL